MEKIQKIKSEIQGIADLNFEQRNLLFIAEMEKQDKIFKSIALIGLGIFIAIVSFCLTFGIF